MYSMVREINELQEILTEDENQILIKALKLIWNIDGIDWTDWYHCKNLQKLIGISVK